jgi:hypothetical protein
MGYFAYRAGMIDGLFKNATAETGGWLGITTPPSRNLLPSTGWVSAIATTAGTLDEDGILMMATPNIPKSNKILLRYAS